jgi:multidrug efflux pump subunit AcrB
MNSLKPATHQDKQKEYRGISSWAIRRPISTIAITSVVIVLGILFSGRLPVDLMPQIDYPHIRVVVNYPGVTPEVIEEQVTRPLERNLSATENLNRDTRQGIGRAQLYRDVFRF